jgi:hypothetical protein
MSRTTVQECCRHALTLLYCKPLFLCAFDLEMLQFNCQQCWLAVPPARLHGMHCALAVTSRPLADSVSITPFSTSKAFASMLHVPN